MNSPRDLQVTLVQAKLYWEKSGHNLAMFDEVLRKVKSGSTHVIVLPEMFNTGFTMNAAENYTTMQGDVVQWMKHVAMEKKAVVCGSVIMKEREKFYNRLLWVAPTGEVTHYDKRHLFRMGNEHETYTAGKKPCIVSLHGWNIMLQVCYDLRFPVWSRNKPNANVPAYDILLYVANWPKRRNYAWKQLLIARAIENQSYVVAVNRIGNDGRGVAHSGDSACINFLGLKQSRIPASRAYIETVTLSYASLQQYRADFPAHMDADQFIIK